MSRFSTRSFAKASVIARPETRSSSIQKRPWYANQWQAKLQDVPVADHGLVLFMLAARWLGMIFTSGRPDRNSTSVTRLTSLTPKHSFIASGGVVCSEVL